MNETIEGDVVLAGIPRPGQSTPLAEFNPLESAIASALRHKGVTFDVATTKGLDEAREARREVRDVRVAVEKTRVQVKAPVLSLAQEIDAHAKALVAPLLPVEEELDTQIKAEEKRRDAAAAERKRVEAERIAAVERKIIAMQELALKALRKPADQVHGMLGDLEFAKPTEAEFQELTVRALETWQATKDRLAELHASKVAIEREQAETTARLKAEAEELDRRNAELKRQQAEQQQREQAMREEAARIERERVELERKKQESESPRPAAAAPAQVTDPAREEGGALYRHEAAGGGNAADQPREIPLTATGRPIEPAAKPPPQRFSPPGIEPPVDEPQPQHRSISGERMRALCAPLAAALDAMQVDQVEQLMVLAFTLGARLRHFGVVIDFDASVALALRPILDGYNAAAQPEAACTPGSTA